MHTIDNKLAKPRRRTLSVLLALALSALLLVPTACSDSTGEEDEYPNWQQTNATYWNSLYANANSRIAAGDSTWKIFKSWTLQDSLHTENTSYIVVHVLEEGTGSGMPLYTDTCRVYYTGWLLPSTSYASGRQFDSSIPDGATEQTSEPTKMAVSRANDGFATALQHMHIGDLWEIYIPWTLAYGSAGNPTGNIPGYSVLRFQVRLHSYFHPGEPVPPFKAKSR